MVHRALEAEQARLLARLALEHRWDITDEPEAPAHAPGDARALRGIPVVGVRGGAGGAVSGSRPTDALKKIAREADRGL